MLNAQQTQRLAKSLLREAGILADTFDGTIGDGAFRNRVATLRDALEIFHLLTGCRPDDYLVYIGDDDGRR
jgi:hypothetical protein